MQTRARRVTSVRETNEASLPTTTLPPTEEDSPDESSISTIVTTKFIYPYGTRRVPAPSTIDTTFRARLGGLNVGGNYDIFQGLEFLVYTGPGSKSDYLGEFRIPMVQDIITKRKGVVIDQTATNIARADYILLYNPSYNTVKTIASSIGVPQNKLVTLPWLVACQKHERLLPRPAVLPDDSSEKERSQVYNKSNIDLYWQSIAVGQEVYLEWAAGFTLKALMSEIEQRMAHMQSVTSVSQLLNLRRGSVSIWDLDVKQLLLEHLERGRHKEQDTEYGTDTKVVEGQYHPPNTPVKDPGRRSLVSPDHQTLVSDISFVDQDVVCDPDAKFDDDADATSQVSRMIRDVNDDDVDQSIYEDDLNEDEAKAPSLATCLVPSQPLVGGDCDSDAGGNSASVLGRVVELGMAESRIDPESSRQRKASWDDPRGRVACSSTVPAVSHHHDKEVMRNTNFDGTRTSVPSSTNSELSRVNRKRANSETHDTHEDGGNQSHGSEAVTNDHDAPLFDPIDPEVKYVYILMINQKISALDDLGSRRGLSTNDILQLRDERSHLPVSMLHSIVQRCRDIQATKHASRRRIDKRFKAAAVDTIPSILFLDPKSLEPSSTPDHPVPGHFGDDVKGGSIDPSSISIVIQPLILLGQDCHWVLCVWACDRSEVEIYDPCGTQFHAGIFSVIGSYAARWCHKGSSRGPTELVAKLGQVRLRKPMDSPFQSGLAICNLLEQVARFGLEGLLGWADDEDLRDKRLAMLSWVLLDQTDFEQADRDEED